MFQGRGFTGLTLKQTPYSLVALSTFGILIGLISLLWGEVHASIVIALISIIFTLGFFLFGILYVETAILCLLLLVPFHSLIFLNLKMFLLPSVSEISYMMSSCWKESLLLGLFTRLCIEKKKRRLILLKGHFFLILTLAIILFIGINVGIYNNIPCNAWLIAFRDLIYPFLIFICIVNLNISHQSLLYKAIRFLILLGIVEAIIAVFQVIIIKDAQTFWFYEYLSSIDRYRDPSYFRYGLFRGTGTFVSPIEYSSYLTLPLVYSCYQFFNTRTAKWGLYCAVIVIGTALSFTRNPLFSSLLACAFLVPLLLRFKRISFVLVMAIVSMLWLMETIAINYLQSIGVLDPSAAGRLPQISKVVASLMVSPWGLGLGAVGSKFQFGFDSNYFTLLVSLGLIGGFMAIGCYFYILREATYTIKKLLRYGPDSFHEFRGIALSIFTGYISFLAYSLFTYNLGSAADVTLFLMLGLVVGGAKCQSWPRYQQLL